MCVALLGAAAGGGLGTVLSIGTSLIGGFMQYQAQNAAAKAAQATAAYNAETARRQAVDARERGKADAQDRQREVAARIAAFSATNAAAGVDPNYGSPLTMAASSAREGASDVETIRKNATRRAELYERQAGLEIAEGQNRAAAARAEGRTALISGAFGALEPLAAQWSPLQSSQSVDFYG